MLTDQWYVDAKSLAKPAIEAVETGRIKFVPEQYKNMYFSWMRDIEDWCFLANYGGGIEYQLGTIQMIIFM